MWYGTICYYVEKAKYSIKHMLPTVWEWCGHAGWGSVSCSISGRTRTQGTRLASGEEARGSGIEGFSSVQSLSRVRLFDPMDCSTPGLPVHHQLPELTQTHVHRRLTSHYRLFEVFVCVLLCACVIVCVCYCMCYWVYVLLCVCSHGHRLLSWINTASVHG